jgi:UDPglucose 6-dehydrogenase
MSAAAQRVLERTPIAASTPALSTAVGVIGRGYVGNAVALGLEPVADVVFHDPAHAGSASLAAVAARDVVFVCVPTPMGAGGQADLSIVEDVLATLSAFRTEAAIVLKSTVPPGTTERLAARHPGLALGVAPEFLRERTSVDDFARPARVVLGWPARLPAGARARVRSLYRARFPAVPIVELAATEAELVKYASNAFFAVKVSFANELAELATALGAGWDAIRAALSLDPRIGDDHLRVPGPDGERGYGGACLPKDVAALLAIAQAAGASLPVVASADDANLARRAARGRR